MDAAKVPWAWRDYCAHLLIPLNQCRQATMYSPLKCTDLRHEYEKCQYIECVREETSCRPPPTCLALRRCAAASTHAAHGGCGACGARRDSRSTLGCCCAADLESCTSSNSRVTAPFSRPRRHLKGVLRKTQAPPS